MRAVGLIELGVITVMVLFNGVFAGYEIVLAAVTVARLQVLVAENRAGAKAALYMKQNMEASLAAVQVAIARGRDHRGGHRRRPKPPTESNRSAPDVRAVGPQRPPCWRSPPSCCP